MDELKTYKVTELKQLCKASNLPSYGNKLDLITRLKMSGYEAAGGGDLSDLDKEVSASDSISQASGKSKASSVSSRAKVAAKRARLEIKAQYLGRQQELEFRLEKEKMARELDRMMSEVHMKEEEMKLKLELDRLKLDAQIHATAAEKEVLSQCDRGKLRTSLQPARICQVKSSKIFS